MNTNLIFAEEKREVLVIPGITGSMSTEIACNNSEAVSAIEELFKLASPTHLTQEWVIDPMYGTYTELQTELVRNGFKQTPVAYNWLLPINQIAEDYLKPIIDEVIFRDREVDIVAHSMGGLVARSYIEVYGSRGIRKVAFLGTPHRGSVSVYKYWEGGEPFADTILKRQGMKTLLRAMVFGCGCRDVSTVDFVRHGCSDGITGPISSVQYLLPVFPYLWKSNSLIDPESMCEQNFFLRLLNANADKMFGLPIQYRIFASSTETTARYAKIGKNTQKNCSANAWQDGKPTIVSMTKNGDNQVLFNESACPKSYIPAFANIPCITEDSIHPGQKKPLTHIEHGALPTIFKEEIVAYLKEPMCGDSYLEGNEQCDDGNLAGGDCCDSQCKFEPAGSQTCGQGACTNQVAQCNGATRVLCAPLAPPEPSGEQSCANGADDNCDGWIDCDDENCTGKDGCPMPNYPGFFTITHNPLPEEDPALGNSNPVNCHTNNLLCTSPHYWPDARLPRRVSTDVFLTINSHEGFDEQVVISVEAFNADTMKNSTACPTGVEVPCADGIPDGTPFVDPLHSGLFFYFEGDYSKTVSDPIAPGSSVLFNAVYQDYPYLPNGRYFIFLKGTGVTTGKTYTNQLLITVSQSTIIYL
ncbi:MAG: hypothetical protein AAB482_00135 [Patescibacteria group bacterium]